MDDIKDLPGITNHACHRFKKRFGHLLKRRRQTKKRLKRHLKRLLKKSEPFLKYPDGITALHRASLKNENVYLITKPGRGRRTVVSVFNEKIAQNELKKFTNS